MHTTIATAIGPLWLEYALDFGPTVVCAGAFVMYMVARGRAFVWLYFGVVAAVIVWNVFLVAAGEWEFYVWPLALPPGYDGWEVQGFQVFTRDLTMLLVLTGPLWKKLIRQPAG